MIYIHISKADGSRREITREEAKEYLASNYEENVCTYDEMLDMENTYPCLFSIIEVRKG